MGSDRIQDGTMTPQSRIFHILRSEYRIIVLIAIIPFAIAAPELLHILNGDPVLALGAWVSIPT